MTFSPLNQKLRVVLALNQKLLYLVKSASFLNRELQAFCQKNPSKYASWRQIVFFKLEAPRLFPVFFDFCDFKFRAPRDLALSAQTVWELSL